MFYVPYSFIRIPHAAAAAFLQAKKNAPAGRGVQIRSEPGKVLLAARGSGSRRAGSGRSLLGVMMMVLAVVLRALVLHAALRGHAGGRHRVAGSGSRGRRAGVLGKSGHGERHGDQRREDELAHGYYSWSVLD